MFRFVFGLILCLTVATMCWLTASPVQAAGFGRQRVVVRQPIAARQRVVVRQPFVARHHHVQAFVSPYVVRQQFVVPQAIYQYQQPAAFVGGCQQQVIVSGSSAFFSY